MKPNLQSNTRYVRRCLWALTVGCAFPSGSALAQKSISGGSTGNGMRIPMPRNVASTGEACLASGDCNDNLPCTDDNCLDGSCVNTPIAGCVPCQLGYECPPVDLVFIMDTSGSMRDEAAALCAQIQSVSEELTGMGIIVAISSLGITEQPGGPYDCLTNTVANQFGTTVPGELLSCPFPDGSAPYETWGPATAIVAQHYPWTAGATRIIVPMSDEGPCNGSRPEGCNDPGDDRESIDNAIAVALANNCRVSPIVGTSSDECVINLGSAIAKATDGRLHQLKNAKSDFKASLFDIIVQTCVANDHCDDRELCTLDDRCVDGVCTGAPIEGCRSCDGPEDCGDGNFCNSDTCVDGFCVWTPAPNELGCCDPDTGAVVAVSDGDPCTLDACNPETGAVTHLPGPAGIPCNDQRYCSIGDQCNESGRCVGTPVHTLECQTDADCFGNTCSPETQHCVCNEIPQLCLSETGALRGDGCHNVGDDVMVNIEIGNSTSLIAGGQFLIYYDPDVLQLVDIVTGNAVDLESPFGTELFRTVNETGGTIFYAVGVILGGPMTYGPAIMASLQFKAIAPCSTAEICFGGENPMSTRLTNGSGHRLNFVPCCSGELRINGDAPALVCPKNIDINAEAGTLSADVAWQSVSATASCPLEDVELTCSSTNDKDLDVEYLLNQGGRAPLGKSSFECKAIDGCGEQLTCNWDVEVRNFNTIEVDLQLSAAVSPGPLQRCVEFAFYSSCTEAPIVVQKTVDFGFPFNLAGRASRVQILVPPGQYYCATARDTMHTLTSRATMSISGGKYSVKFVGDPDLGGNWLVGGNLDGNNVIDSLDQAIIMAQYLQSIDPQTPCGSSGPHPDINGDGLINTDDLVFVQRHFLKTDAAPCCQPNTASDGASGLAEISLEELRDLGYGDLSAADLNNDGVIDAADMELLIRRDQSDGRVSKQYRTAR